MPPTPQPKENPRFFYHLQGSLARWPTPSSWFQRPGCGRGTPSFQGLKSGAKYVVSHISSYVWILYMYAYWQAYMILILQMVLIFKRYPLRKSRFLFYFSHQWDYFSLALSALPHALPMCHLAALNCVIKLIPFISLHGNTWKIIQILSTVTGIEPRSPVWQPRFLPMNHRYLSEIQLFFVVFYIRLSPNFDSNLQIVKALKW